MKYFIIGSMILAGIGLLTFFVILSEDEESIQSDYAVLPLPISENKHEPTKVDINQEFIRFVNNPNNTNTFVVLSDEEGPLSLDSFTEALEVEVPDALNGLLDTYEWSLYKCNSSKEVAMVLSLHFKLQNNYVGNLYQDQKQLLRSWETQMVNEIAPILYSNTEISSLAQTGSFVTGEAFPYVDLRQTTVRTKEGSFDDFAYLLVGDELLFSNDVQCLLEAQELIFDTGA